MEDKFKKLNTLTDKVVKRLFALEKEKSLILAELEKAKKEISFLKKEQEKYKSLLAWQKETTALIKQVQNKIAKEIKKIEEGSSKPHLGDNNE